MPTQVSAAVNTAHLYALVAGESSGDTLGAGLMRAILRSDPKASFIGIGGEENDKSGAYSAWQDGSPVGDGNFLKSPPILCPYLSCALSL